MEKWEITEFGQYTENREKILNYLPIFEELSSSTSSFPIPFVDHPRGEPTGREKPVQYISNLGTQPQLDLGKAIQVFNQLIKVC